MSHVPVANNTAGTASIGTRATVQLHSFKAHGLARMSAHVLKRHRWALTLSGWLSICSSRTAARIALACWLAMALQRPASTASELRVSLRQGMGCSAGQPSRNEDSCLPHSGRHFCCWLVSAALSPGHLGALRCSRTTGHQRKARHVARSALRAFLLLC